MALIVQKYGGTSVKDVDRIRNVAQRIKKTVDEGHQVAVVVSARGGVTNELVSRAKELNARPDDREMDMLLACGEQETIALTTMALHALGIPAVSRLGHQARFPHGRRPHPRPYPQHHRRGHPRPTGRG